jgi:DNA adenine methylase
MSDLAALDPAASAGSAPPARLRPPLKWAGGKRWQVPHLRALWSGHEQRKLVEPFCGGLSVALALRPSRALLNDVNAHLIHFYRWLQAGLTITLEMHNDERLYYQHRETFNDLLRAGQTSAPEAAALFYYLNRTGYNGLCRFNRRGEFNVPFGRYARIGYTRDFSPYAAVLSSWEFTSADFEQLTLDQDDFVYADPPYDVPFTQYARGGFSWDDQVRAARWLSAHRGPVVLVNQATPRILALYESLSYRLTMLEAPRRISCTGDRGSTREVLASRNLS